MKFIIKHEIKGRIRISLARKFHTVREADVLEQYLLGLDGVTAAKVYEADSRGQQWLKEVDQVLTEEMGEEKDSTQCSLDIKDRLGELYDRESGLISTDIPMDRGQSLRIELVLMCGEKHYDIKSWYVYASDEYEIDNSMPVWGGAAPFQE